ADDVDPAATTDPDGTGITPPPAAGLRAPGPEAGSEAAEEAPAPVTPSANGNAPSAGHGPVDAPVPVPRPDHARSGHRAVGAAVELEDCLAELDRLSDAVRAGRAGLRDVLRRLAAAGLRPDQLARLARMPQAEVDELLADAPAQQQALRSSRDSVPPRPGVRLEGLADHCSIVLAAQCIAFAV